MLKVGFKKFGNPSMENPNGATEHHENGYVSKEGIACCHEQ